MFTIKGCSLIRGVHYERFHCIGEQVLTGSCFFVNVLAMIDFMSVLLLHQVWPSMAAGSWKVYGCLLSQRLPSVCLEPDLWCCPCNQIVEFIIITIIIITYRPPIPVVSTIVARISSGRSTEELCFGAAYFSSCFLMPSFRGYCSTLWHVNNSVCMYNI